MLQIQKKLSSALYIPLDISIFIPQLIVSFGFGIIVERAENKNVVFIISAIALCNSALLWNLVKEEPKSQSS